MKNIEHSELWINTGYFVEALRCICSLSYLKEHIEVCQFINSKDFVDGKLHRFYINLCALVDIHCEYRISKSKRAAYKKMLKTMCPLFNWMFYERDKNAAHKDSNYLVEINMDLSDLIVKMKKAIETTNVVCSNIISNDVECSYYSYDSLLFRYINGITPNIEKALNESIYIKPQFNEENCIELKSISDARQVRSLDEHERYCVVCSNGLIGQPYDMLEHRQDMCLKLNAMYNSDIWVTLQSDDADRMLKMFFAELGNIVAIYHGKSGNLSESSKSFAKSIWPINWKYINLVKKKKA